MIEIIQQTKSEINEIFMNVGYDIYGYAHKCPIVKTYHYADRFDERVKSIATDKFKVDLEDYIMQSARIATNSEHLAEIKKDLDSQLSPNPRSIKDLRSHSAVRWRIPTRIDGSLSGNHLEILVGLGYSYPILSDRDAMSSLRKTEEYLNKETEAKRKKILLAKHKELLKSLSDSRYHEAIDKGLIKSDTIILAIITVVTRYGSEKTLIRSDGLSSVTNLFTEDRSLKSVDLSPEEDSEMIRWSKSLERKRR